MVCIQQDLGVPTLFVRYNPDRYDGLQLIKKQRTDYLLKLVNLFKEMESIKCNLDALYLYYDGFNGSPMINSIYVESICA